MKKKGEKTHINKIRNEEGKITTDTTELQRIVRNYCKELYAKKSENQGEMDRFLEKYNLPKLNEEEAESLNRTTTARKMKQYLKKTSQHTKALEQMDSQENFTKHLMGS